jgi:hypothetical protein
MKRFTLPPDFIRSDDLSRIVQYVADQQNKHRCKTVFLHLGVSLIAGIAPITYLKPSYADTPPYGLPDHSSIRIGQVISTWAATTALLYLACTDYMETRLQYLTPPELTEIIDGLTPEQIRRQDWGIGMISIASAVPLTTPLIKFPLISTGDNRLDTSLNTGLVIVILASNTIAHLRPLQVIINNPWYGAPLAAVKFLKNKVKQLRMTVEEKQYQQFRDIENYNKNRLKNNFQQTLLANGDQIIQECFIFHWLPFPGYRIQLTDYFKHINSLTDDAFIFGLIDAQLRNPSQIIMTSGYKRKFYSLLRNALSQVAGILALGESIGYLGDSIIELAKLLRSILGGWLLGAIPVYAFGVLIHNAARVQTLDVIDFLSDLIRGQATLSWPLKYGARAFFGLLLIPSLLILLLNSSAANVMTRFVLDEYCSDTFIDRYISIFRWGYVWLATLLVINTEKYLFEKSAKYLGHKDAQAIAYFSERVKETVNTRVSQWKPERFIGWINQQTPDFREQALNISEELYQKLIQNPENSKDDEVPLSSVQRYLASCCECIWMFLTGHCFDRRTPERENLINGYQLLEGRRGERSRGALQLQSQPVESSWWDTICCFWQRNTPENIPPSSSMSYEV